MASLVAFTALLSVVILWNPSFSRVHQSSANQTDTEIDKPRAFEKKSPPNEINPVKDEALSYQKNSSQQTLTVNITIPEGAWEPKGQGFNYSPAQVVVIIGLNNTVSWDNLDKIPHTVTANDGSFNSGEIAPYGLWNYTFEKPGKYEYYCTLHLAIMMGEVTVNGR